MHGSHRRWMGYWIAPGFVAAALCPATSRADDNGFFGRLFRMGGNPPASTARRETPEVRRPPSEPPSGSYESAFGDIGTGSRPARVPSPTPVGGPIPSEGPSTPEPSGNDAQPRLSPRPRVTPAATTADPLLTRVALGKSNDGTQFGMFLQVFADGTVIDSEGVHKLAPSDIRPLVEAIQGGELARVKGHCGTPSNDFIEYVQVVAFERRMGRLQAHSFSYGGNPQGCDAGIRRIHGILENLQAKLSRPQPGGTVTAPPAGEQAASPPPVVPPSALASPPAPATVIPLSPESPH